MNEIVTRPWGQYENLLDSNQCKVKVIKIEPGKQPSYQYHHKREEHWVVVSGIGEVIVDEKNRTVKQGDYIFVPLESKHRIKNLHDTESLVFIEVQLGTYFGEDDIVRVQDDFGRC